MKATFAILALLGLTPALATAQTMSGDPPAATPGTPAGAGAPAPTTPDEEPLPADAPTQPYQLAAWCYGAMDQYLYIYGRILPQLREIDRLYGTSEAKEPQPYADDMAAAKVELGVLKNAVEAAEKASIKVISPEGSRAVSLGRSIWGPAETHSRRELARAWLSWALPDRCDSNARELAAKSNLLGLALKYNGPSATASRPAPVKLSDDADTGEAISKPEVTSPMKADPSPEAPAPKEAPAQANTPTSPQVRS